MYVKKCAHCGKTFVVSNQGEYTYKFSIRGKIVYFCSYTCFRVARKKYEEYKNNSKNVVDKKKFDVL